MSRSDLIDLVVSRYISSDLRLSDIVAALADGSEPVVDAMNLLCQCINGNHSASAAFISAKKVDINIYSDDICILFMSCWAHASNMLSPIIAERLPEAWAIIQRARTLITSSTAPEIVCYVNTVESYLVSSEGNHDRQEQILADSLKLLSKDSPRRKHLILEYAANLSMGGRLKDAAKHLNSITTFNKNFKKNWVTAVKFINLVENGSTSEAAVLAIELSRSEFDSVPLRNFQKYSILMSILSAPVSLPDEDKPQLPTIDDAPDWAMVLHCLLSNKLHQALRWARIGEKKSELYLTGRDFTSFNLLRTELAESNIEAARRIVDIRHSHGNHHYLDNLFLSRIALLENDEDTAAETFALLLRDIDKYKAHGRLDFELRISAEIPRDTLFRMINTAQRIRTAKSSKAENTKITTSKSPSLPSPSSSTERIVYSSPAMISIMSSIQKFAKVDVPVLITGETGTGKELTAKALHDSGNRSTKPFVAINCGAISESLLESELFGHAKGAFSGASTSRQGLFEEADGGTIFLDEIGEITPRLQVALLRVLETSEIRPVGSSQSKAISCRVVASTNADLQQLERDNQFRSDLIYRLRRLEIHMPALRERTEDILLLTTHFLNIGRPQDVYATMSSTLAHKLLNYNWPGNIRELRNAVERMRLMNSDKLYYDADDMELGTETILPIIVSPEQQPPKTIASYPDNSSKVDSTDSPVKTGRSRIRRLTRLREMFNTHEILTRIEIAQTFEISPNTAGSDLKILQEEGFIIKIQPTASPRSTYFEISQK